MKAAMRTLSICDVGLPADASRAFHSMLKVVDGRSIASWRSSEMAQADVLLTYAQGDAGVPSSWVASGKPAVLVIDDRANWPPAQYVLRYPFRVMQLLSMLDSVAEYLCARPTDDDGTSGAWATAESVRRLVTQAGEKDWHVAYAENGCRVWVGNGLAHAECATLRSLREGTLALGAFSITDEAPTANLPTWPLGELAWFVGAHGPAGLAPWLQREASHRLRRWPDFGRLGVMPNMIELAAAATGQAGTAQELAGRVGCDVAAAERFLSAASLAGLLTSSPAPVVARTNTTVPQRGAWMRFVSDLRRHLLPA